MDTITKLADHAAQQSDRWLFIAALLIMGLGAFLAMRHLVKQNAKLIDDHARARDTYQQSLKEMVSASNEQSIRVVEVLTRNTVALDETANEIRLCREDRQRRGH